MKNVVKNIVIIPLHLLESFLPYEKYSMLVLSIPFEGIRLNDNLSTPLTLHDELFMYLARIVYWLDQCFPTFAILTPPYRLDTFRTPLT